MTTLRLITTTAFLSGLALAALPRARAQSVYTYPYTTVAFAGTLRTPGSADGNPGEFQLPEGVAVDPSGNVYVGDTGDDTVRVVSPSGTITTLAGQHTVQGATNGTGAAAQFNGPLGVALDSQGNVYVADVTNDEIRKIAPGGVVTTLAGTAGVVGSVDGTGPAANFSSPSSVAVDAQGNVYVADTYNDTIRKITPAGVVTTIAGSAGVTGSVDGTGSGARFFYPAGVAVDGSDNVYVADTHNDTIRKITPAGVVTTIAGSAGVTGSTDGAGTAARFSSPIGITVDAGGNIYVADEGNDTIRIISSGTVSTLAGAAGDTGTTLGTGSTARFYEPFGVAVDTNGNIYVADSINTVVRKGSSAAVPVITAQPQSATITAGGSASFSVTATGALSYQWYLNGAAVTGATSSTLSLSLVGTDRAGSYTVAAINGAGTATSSAATLTVNYTAQLIDLSARADVGTGGSILIGGLYIGGSGGKNLLLRGDGPALVTAQPSLAGEVVARPQLTLFDSSSTEIVSDAGWQTAFTTGSSSVSVSPQAATAQFMSSVGAYPPFASGSADSAMEVTPPSGSSYTFEIAGVGGTTGIGQAEIYDAAPSSGSRLTNISARAAIGTGGNILIGGLVISGSTDETILIRGDGPALQGELAGSLTAPEISLIDSSGNTVATDIGWSNAPTKGNSTIQAGVDPATTALMNSVGAYPVFANGSGDCAMVVVLPPGAYTVEMSGVGGTTGIGLVEIYEIP